MRKYLRAPLLAVSLLAVTGIDPQSATAIEVEPDCSDVQQALQGTTPPAVLNELGVANTDELLTFIIGQQFGVPAFLRNLLCFTGDPRCSCLENLLRSETSEFAAYSVKLDQVLTDCAQNAPTRSLSGVAQQAALDVCD